MKENERLLCPTNFTTKCEFLKPTERALVPLKTVIGILQNSPPLKIWIYFCITSLDVSNAFNTLILKQVF